MTRVHHVQHARKDYPEHGIAKGDEYYWWKFRFGPKHMSKKPPTRQQTTQSDFLSRIYDFEDALGALEANDDIQSAVESIAEEIESFADEQDEKRDNMPEGLQEGDVGQMLQERGEALRAWAEDLRNIDSDLPDKEEKDEGKEDDEGKDEEAAEGGSEAASGEASREDRIAEIIEEAQATSYDGP